MKLVAFTFPYTEKRVSKYTRIQATFVVAATSTGSAFRICVDKIIRVPIRWSPARVMVKVMDDITYNHAGWRVLQVLSWRADDDENEILGQAEPFPKERDR